MKASTSSVTSYLGRGADVHLGIILTPLGYALVSPIEYIRPVNPGNLTIKLNNTQHETTWLQEDHKESIKLYRKTALTEKALIKQLGQALPDLYMRSYRNEHTNTITTNIPTLLEHLFTTYGSIELEELQEKVDTLRQKVFEILEPLIVIYNEVNEIQELATASGNTFTPKQLIAIVIQFIKNLNDFEKGLTTWYDLLPSE